jgi:hypothetical protein
MTKPDPLVIDALVKEANALLVRCEHFGLSKIVYQISAVVDALELLGCCPNKTQAGSTTVRHSRKRSTQAT